MMRSTEIQRDETAGRETALASLPRYVRLPASQSSLGFKAGDANLYRYVGNDPADNLDPTGLEEKKRPYPDKLGEIGSTKSNDEAGIIGGLNNIVGAGRPDRKGRIKARPKKEIKPKQIPPDQINGVRKPGNNIVSGTHAFFGWPNKQGQFFGTGGCQGCIGVIIRCRGGYGAIFHFGALDDPASTLANYKDVLKCNGDCMAVVFGGDDTATSRGLLSATVDALSVGIGMNNIYYADSDHLHIGVNGDFYTRLPGK